MMRMALIVLVLLSLIAVALPAPADDVKIAVVDLGKVIDLSKQGKKATEEITSRVKSAKGDLEKRGAELAKMKQEIESRAMTLAPEALAKKERTYQDKNLEYQRRLEDYESTLGAKSGELDRTISALVKDVVEKIGGGGGYSLILELTRSGVLYYSADVDLTDTVIEELNKR